MRALFFALAFLFSNLAFAETESITVLDSRYEPIKTIASKEEISIFKSAWASKIESRTKIRINWSEGFKIDINGSNSSGRWLYNGGWVMPLSKSPSGLYKIENINQFESVLGITHKKQR